MTFDFREKTVLVTGGTSGIGEAVAHEFRELGATVVAKGLPNFDVCRDDHIRDVLRGLKSLDILVNCAGMILRDKEFELETFQKVLEVNLTGTMRMCIESKPLLELRQGSIVNIASMLSYFGGARVPAYSASKGGVAQLTKSLAIAWAPTGIRVNAVAPGWIATSFTQALQDDPQRSLQILQRTPMNRWGTAEEVAKAVVFLCSPAATFITGAVLPVDGGYSAA